MRSLRPSRSVVRRVSAASCLLALATSLMAQGTPAAPVTAIRAGRLVDPETGTVANNQVILVQGGRFTAIGPNVPVPAGAQVIDLSSLTVLPGLVDAAWGIEIEAVAAA